MNDPRRVLEAIPGFADAVVVERLSGGPTNQSYEIEQGGNRFVLRLDTPEAARLGLDRHSEKAVVDELASADLGQAPVHFDPAAGVYLRCWLPGRSWVPADLECTKNLQRLAGLLRRVHALPPAGQPFKPLKAAGRYARQIGTASAGNLFIEAATAYALIEPSEPAICHNDLVCQNILEGKALALIDWEYTGTGDPFFDLAVIVQHHGLNDALANTLLASYLGRDPADADTHRLGLQQNFYQALLNLWNLRIH